MTSNPSAHNRQTGQWGAALAADYLAGKAYEIVARNVRTPYGEIDIIARKLDVTLFVEVKTRTSAAFGLPEESVNGRKLKHMISAAAYYAATHEIDHWQIDVVSVEGKPGMQPLITHFENVP